MATPFQSVIDVSIRRKSYSCLPYISELMFDQKLDNTTVDRE